jgi:general secretion pathway protein G
MNQVTSSPRRAPVRFFLGLAVALCLVVTVVTFSFRGRTDPSWKRVHADLAVIDAALDRYRADHGSLPETDSLDFLVPEYLPAEPVDPWGRPYLFENNGKKPLVVTFGHDGERGGDGEEQDHHQYDGHVR